MTFSRLIHTASVTAVYASRFGFPYTGKTRFRSGDSPYRMGLEPIRLLQRISNVALSPPIPTLQALPGATDLCLFMKIGLYQLLSDRSSSASSMPTMLNKDRHCNLGRICRRNSNKPGVVPEFPGDFRPGLLTLFPS